MELLDVAVIGAGPAGSSAARRLAAYGLRTVVLDKASFPRDKCCAGWITPGVFEDLSVAPVQYGRNRTLQRLHGLVVWDTKGNPRRFPVFAGWGIRRAEFDAFLAKRLGGSLIQGHPVRRLQRVKGGIRIDNDFQARLVIGAGGHFCPVALQLAKAKRHDEWTIAALCTEGLIPERFTGRLGQWAGWPHIIFTPDFSGYGWFFVKGRFLNTGIGVVGARGGRVRSMLDWMIGRLHAKGLLPPGLINALPPFHGHFYKLYSRVPRQVFGEDFLLAGDAAGMASPFSGEGIGPAVVSGQLAAEVAVAALSRQGPLADSLGTYRDMLQAEFGSMHRGVFARLMEHLRGRMSAPLMTAILDDHRLTRRVVVERWFSAFDR